MFLKSNGFRSSIGRFFVFIDSLLILTGVALGNYLRFYRGGFSLNSPETPVLQWMVMVFVIQICFYYFDLYDLKIFKQLKRLGLLIIGALIVSTIILALIYYLIPPLALGRGVFIISLFLIMVFAFNWRITYVHLLKPWVTKEKILIIGTGELAQKIKHEILDNGHEGFEIVGFIDENRDKIGRTI